MKRFLPFLIFITSYNSIAQPVWQQHVDTKIDVRLDDKNNFLHAFEELVYTNSSPDTLRYIYMHLWANAYKNDRTPFARQLDLNRNTAFYYSKAADRGYIDSLQFLVDGQSAEFNIAENTPDIARIELPRPIMPGQKMTITTPFRVKIPKVFSRMGHTGQAYYISQWFPKPAVYDQKGWHPISYLDMGEFYSEYGSYDVHITLPANYVLMATGNCMDEKEQAWLDERAKDSLPPDTLYSHSMPPSTPEMKTVHFHEDNVHDFAWFADKRWIVRKDTVYSPGNGLLVTTWAAFLPSYQGMWAKATGYLKETVKHYGKWVGPYQYKTIKAVLGDMHAGGGMEYPTVTVIDEAVKSNLQTVVVHEAGHNWFYGMLGSNERDHAWMDEGINTFYEQKTDRDINKDSSAITKKNFNEELLYYEMAATHRDQPIDLPSADFTKLNYGLDVYYKTGLALRWLEAYMGEAQFETGMKDYFSLWHFHHPYPEDFRAVMQQHSAASLAWFFDTILHTDNKIDFTITKARKQDNGTAVTVRNNTGIFSPALVDAYKGDSLVAHAWTQPFIGKTTISLPANGWNKLKIDDVVADSKPANDVYHRGQFHHFGLQLKTFVGINTAEKDRLFISPAFANNQYDGIMAGLVFHDLTLPENRFRFALAPLYSFGTRSVAGTGSIGYLWYSDGLFKEIMLQADGKSFHDNETLINLTAPLYTRYAKAAPSLNFIFNEHNPLSTVTRALTVKGYYVTEENIFFADSLSKPVLHTQQNMYGLVRYHHTNDRTYNPFNYSVEYHGNGDFGKLSAEGNIRIDYDVKNKSLYVRGYLGKYFAINNDPAVTSRYELNSSFNGMDDYLYDGTYKGRNEINGLGAHQVSIQEGGFKVPVYNMTDRSDNWLAAINLATDLPKWKINLPIRLFFDAGLIPNAAPSFTHSSSTTMIYDGGVEFYVIKNIVSVYLPVIMSDDFRNYLTNTYGRKHVFERSISFTLQLQNINWLRFPEKVLKTAQ
jgi:hypothetical protein